MTTAITDFVAPVPAPPPAAGLPAKGGTPPIVTMALALVGLVIGVGLAIGLTPGKRDNPYPSLSVTPNEPVVAAQVAVALSDGNARALAQVLGTEQLQALAQGIQPVVTVLEIKFLGSVERSGETLAAYALQGRDRQGQNIGIGYVLHVVDQKVVGVN